MTASSAKSPATVGFLTICQQNDHSLVGGYLVLNAAGRPLEFHCTVPVRPSRAQEILYGPTLKPYLYGEQIGRALLGKAASAPLFVCTDVEPVLALRDHTNVPVVLVAVETTAAREDEPVRADRAGQHRWDAAHPGPPRALALHWFQLGEQRSAVCAQHASDLDAVQQRWQGDINGLNLCEPFQRIREALEEAQRAPSRT